MGTLTVVRASLRAAAAVLAAALVVAAGAVTAVNPDLGALAVAPLVVLAAAAVYWAGSARAAAAVAGAAVLAGAAFLTALDPLVGAIAAVAICLVTLTTRGATGRDAALRFVRVVAPPLGAV